ncbi:LADA_0C01222g1_1 [Lachancea dasiensis]|uniref:LADA_0C01222g1_1 n=1 Tax=Lachancea dasiensis TaxID=1072105 RepID=A0A1G4IXP2_9SACH|nr:LADA_0C01222g1_1 [Lachancea dasiensis]
MNSLYELDSKWRDLLKLNNFLGGLTVHEFVQEISNENSLRDRAANTGAWEHLDPKPYIRTFESTVKELQKLKTEASDKEGHLEQEVAKFELLHAQRVLQLRDNLKSIVRDSDALDSKLTNVTQVVAPLGEKLEKSIKQKNMYIKSVELISHYSEFHTKGFSHELELLKGSRAWKSRARAAILAKNLLILAKKIETKSLPTTVATTTAIEKYAEDMENQFLVEFNSAYRDSDFEQLTEIAIILNRYNNGLNVIQSFINQHAYFADLVGDEDDFMFDEAFKSKISDIDYHSICYEKTIIQNLDEIETVIKEESKVVKQVFEKQCAYVMQLFVQRIFTQKIQPSIEMLLNASLSLSDLAFVRMLYALFALVGQFVKDLSEYFHFQDMDSKGEIASSLERCFGDAFSKMIYDRTKYFELEKRSLEHALVLKTSNFCLKHDKQIYARALNAKLVNGASFTHDLDLQELSSTSSGKLSQINHFLKSQLEKEKKRLMTPELTGSTTDGKPEGLLSNSIDPSFSVQGIDGMLKCAIESIARIMELVPSKANEFTYEIVETVLIGTIGSYVEAGLEVAYSEMLEQDLTRNSEVQLFYLDYVAKSTEILSLISASIKTVVLPLFVNSPDTKKAIISITNNYIRRCELLMNIVVDETIIAFTQRFVTSLSKQKKKDFLSSSQDILDNDTLPAAEIIRDLNSLYPQVSSYLKSENLKSFLQQIGGNLCLYLFDHYKKFQVSSVGGIIVTKDIIGIQTAIEEWSVDPLLDDFATLRELANLFTVQPEELNSLTSEGHLATVDRNLISAYVSRRADFNQTSFVSKIGLS